MGATTATLNHCPIASLLLVYLQFTSICAHACSGGGNPPSNTAYRPPYREGSQGWQAPNAQQPQQQLPQLINSDGTLNNAEPITPLTAPSPTRNTNREGNEEPANTIVQNPEPGRKSSFSERIHSIGEKLANVPDNIGNAAEEAANKVSNAFKQAGESALAKLKDSSDIFPEKLRPMFDNAVQIFSQPGNEKSRWDQLVRTVENAVGLSDADKSEFYNKIVQATVQQFH